MIFPNQISLTMRTYLPILHSLVPWELRHICQTMLLLLGLFALNQTSTHAQCSSCVGPATVRITSVQWPVDGDPFGSNEYSAVINGLCFTADGEPGTYILGADVFTGTGSTNISVSSWEDDSDDGFGCGGRCSFDTCFFDDDDGFVSGNIGVDLTQPSWGNIAVFGGGAEGTIRIAYDVICETASPIMLDIQADYPDYCGEALFATISVNNPLYQIWEANQNLVILAYSDNPNDFPTNPYFEFANTMTTIGNFSFGTGGNAISTVNFASPAHSGNNCEVETYIVYAMYDPAVAAALGLDDCMPWVSMNINAWPNPQTLIANGVITPADVQVTYSGCTAFFSLPPDCDLKLSPSQVNLAPGQTAVNLTLSDDIASFNNFCTTAILTVPVQEALVATVGTCVCSGGVCGVPITISNGSGDYGFVAINGVMVGTDFQLFDGEYSGFVQVTDNITGCQELVPVFCEGAQVLAQAEARDILGLNALYCVDDPDRKSVV